MEALGGLFHTIVTQPIVNALVGFYKVFELLSLPGAFGWAIIAITLAIRFVLYPFFKQQLETAEKMNELKPKLDAIQKKYKNKPEKLQKEQLKLYQEAGVNPAGGCLTALIQIPLFLGLYQTLQLFLQTDTTGEVVKQINSDLYFAFLKITSIDPNFFGLNLALAPSAAGNNIYLIFPVITAGLQFLQSRITMPAATAQIDQVKTKQDLKDGKEDAKEEVSTSEEFQKAMTTQMKYFFPVMIGYFSYSLPLGLSVYWNVFSLFSIIQHYMKPRGENKKDK